MAVAVVSEAEEPHVPRLRNPAQVVGEVGDRSAADGVTHSGVRYADRRIGSVPRRAAKSLGRRILQSAWREVMVSGLRRLGRPRAIVVLPRRRWIPPRAPKSLCPRRLGRSTVAACSVLVRNRWSPCAGEVPCAAGFGALPKGRHVARGAAGRGRSSRSSTSRPTSCPIVMCGSAIECIPSADSAYAIHRPLACSAARTMM